MYVYLFIYLLVRWFIWLLSFLFSVLIMRMFFNLREIFLALLIFDT